jgi:hypothetical protein
MMTVMERVDRTSAAVSVGLMQLASPDLRVLEKKKLGFVWVFFAVLILVGAAVAFSMCLSRGYRGFSGNIRWHTTWKVPIGIDLGCV